MAKGVKKEKEEKKETTNKDVLDSFLKTNKSFHYNFEEEKYYKVSTGSILMDIEMGGGYGPGLHRLCGQSGGGKTSHAIEVMRNFLKEPKRRGFYIKAEGRLSPEMRERCGVKFVFNPSEWEEGTCFVLETNIYETAVDAMKKLVFENADDNQYCFILDSVDGLNLKSDLEKETSDANKVAGGAVVASVFMKRMSIALSKRGHIAFFISQVRSQIQIDPYAKKEYKMTNATGGNALIHFADWIMEFQPTNMDDLIVENDSLHPTHEKNKILGHFAKIIVRKSTNEKQRLTFKYPVKYGVKQGSSVWVERELIDLLTAWEIIARSGSWFTVDPEFIKSAEDSGVDLSDVKNSDGCVKFQGLKKIYDLVSSNKEFQAFIKNYFVEILHGI